MLTEPELPLADPIPGDITWARRARGMIVARISVSNLDDLARSFLALLPWTA